jgi:SAM-dependent methyltransferase
MLDCACNCGAYVFWAKELGAGEGVGFDVHRHWIDQAQFLQAHRVQPSDGLRFEVRDLYELPSLGWQQFDITLFNGIFYHLPDPVQGLRIAADLTRELLMVNTATWNGQPDGMLKLAEESAEFLMSGVYGLNWFPTGPEVMTKILHWLGFPEVRLRFHRTDAVPNQRPELGRLELLAARSKAAFEQYDSRNER